MIEKNTNDSFMENIDKYIDNDEFLLEFIDDDGESFTVKATDYVHFADISVSIETIVDHVAGKNYQYEYFDLALAYCVIDLFTEIPVPMTTDENGEEIIDACKCFDICTRLGIIKALCETSDNAAELIAVIEKNVWRRLEYLKTMESTSGLNRVCDYAYDLLIKIDDVIDGYSNVNLKEATDVLKDTLTKLNIV